MPTPLDKRLNAFRPDRADKKLEGHVQAENYVQGCPFQVIEPVAALRRHPRFDAPLDTQCLYGEIVDLFDDAEGWAWVQSRRDGYVGYMSKDSLSSHIYPPTHKVKALRTFAYPAPDMKTPPLATLVLNSEITVTEEAGKFLKTNAGYYIYAAHVASLDVYEEDFVSVAVRFAGVPYLWGGCTALGIDCSGLVQTALQAAGRTVLRDSDMQENSLGTALPDPTDFSALGRRDLVFWKGHVGIMVDTQNIIHANGYHMETVIEPVSQAVSRIATLYGELTSIKRI